MKVDTTLCFVVLLALFAFHEVQAHDHGHRGWRHHLNRRFDVGYALRFDGDDYVSVPSMDLGTPLSFEFLYRVGPNGGGTVFSFQSGSAFIRLTLSRNNNNLGNFLLEVGQPNNQGQVTPKTYQTGNFFPKNNKWQYVVIIFKHNGQVQFWLEESDVVVQKDSGNIQTSVNWRTFTNNFIGKRTNNTNYFLGDLDEVRFWTKELSANDDRDRTREIDVTQRSLQAWYNFNQGLGSIATDVAFKGKDGVLGGNNPDNTPQWIVAGFTATRTCKVFGDPNIKTFDRKCLRLGTNRIGDYWLVNSDQDFLIQTRIATKPGSSSNTAVIGLAFETADHWVVIDLDFRSKTDSILKVDGNIVSTGSFIDNGMSIIKDWENANKHTYEIDVPFAFSAKITAFARAKYSEITVRVISESNSGGNHVSGICGNFDGSEGNDGDSTSWPVDPSENLFDGPVDLGTPDAGYDCDIDTSTLPQETITRAHQICENPAIVLPYLADSCLFDVCATGDITAAYGSAEISYFECLEDNENGTAAACPKPCPNFCSFQGNCSSVTGTCTCNPNQYGADCSQTKNYRCYSASWSGRQKDLTAFGGLANAANHYKYSTTYGFSSDTGKELADTTVAYIYEQRSYGSAPKPNLIFINDKARDGTGGRAKVEFALNNGYANNALQISPRDDPDDTYRTSSFRTNGKFTAEWDWWSCCTDGLVLGPLPDSFCVSMNMTVRDGINQVVVSSDNMFGTQDTYKVETSSFKICGDQCNNTCGVYSDCNACTADSECGWCVETETCELGSAAGPDRGRCNLWRYASDSTTSRVVKTTIGFPVDPSNVEVFVPQNAAASANFFVFFPAPHLMPIDIALLVDLTRSASFELSYIQSATASSFANILSAYPQARLAIGSFSDRPEFGFGTSGRGDIAYAENLAFTDNLIHIQIALNALAPKDGLDDRNSQLEALQKAAASTTLSWRASAMKIAVIVTKTLPHLPPSTEYNGNAALDYPSVDAVRATLIAQNVIPIFVVPHTIATDYQNYVNAIGFGYVSRIVDGNIGSIYATVLDTVTSIVQSARAIPVPGQSQNFATNAVYPAAGYTGISAGTRVQFTANIVNNGASTGAILVPGFGTVNFKFITSDLPYLVGVPPALSVTDGRTNDIITLETAGYYSSGSVQIISTPAAAVASLYQVNPGNAQGVAIPVNGIVSDAQNRIWVQYAGSGSTSFTFKVVDGCRASSQIYTVTISVRSTNQNPSAQSRSVSTAEDTPLSITLIGNDPDNNTPLTYWITTLPDSAFASLKNGATTITTVPYQLPANSVTLTPATDRFGSVSFNYRVTDSLGAPSNDATVSAAITADNDAPVAIGSNVNVAEDSYVLVNLAGTDSWGETLPQNLIRNIVQTPTNGKLSLTVGGAQLPTGAIGTASAVYYTPFANYNGADSFEFTVTDDGIPARTSLNQATVGITVTAMNDAPQSYSQTFSALEDANVTIVLDGTDVDDATGTLRAVICSWSGVGYLYDGNNLVPNPSTNYAVQSTTRTLRYTPIANAYGQPVASFTFKIVDPSGASSSCFSANINILAQNDAPVAIAPTTVYVNETQTVQIVLRGYDVDITDHPLNFTLCNSVDAGVLSALGTPTQVQVDMSQAIISYTAPVGQTATSFQFRVKDDRTPNPPSIQSPCVTVNIVVNNVNDPPTATSNSFSGLEDNDVQITLAGTDPDSDPLIYFIQSLPTVGSLWQADNSFQKISQIGSVPLQLSNNKVVYVPPPNAFSASPLTSFTFAVRDATLFSQPAVIAISINAVNDAPVASPFTFTTYMNTDAIVSGFIALDVDNVDSDITFYVSPGSITGQIFACNNPSCSSTTQIVTETAVATRKVVYRPATGAFSPNNQTYESFTYRAWDLGNFSAPVSVGAVIFFVNSPPEAYAQPDNITTDAGQCVSLQISSQDPDGDPVQTFVLWSDFIGRLFQNNSGSLGDEILQNGTAVSDPNGYIWYCAPTNPGGREGDTVTSLLFQAQDSRGAQSPLVSVSVAIRRPNPAPTANTTGRLIPEDTKLDIVLQGSDPNRPSETFTCRITALPSKGTLYLFGGAALTAPTPILLPECRVEYQADQDDNGNAYATFNYTVTGFSSGQTSAPGVVVIDISPVPDAPVPNTPRPVTDEDTPIDFQIVVSDPDINRPSDSFTVTITAVPSSGTLFQLTSSMTQGNPITVGSVVTNPNLYVRYIPAPNFQGTDVFRYTLFDSYGLSYPGEISLPIDILSVNDHPVGIVTNNTGQNNIFTTNVLIKVLDVDSLPSAISIFFTELPARGTLYANAVLPGNEVQLNQPYATFNFKYVVTTPYDSGANYDTFTWRAYDGIDFSDVPTTDFISILYINTPPTITSQTSYITTEDQQFQITLTATDPDVGQTIRFVIYNSPAKGTLLRSDGVTPLASSFPVTMVAPALIYYKPNADANTYGTVDDSFQIEARDIDPNPSQPFVYIKIIAVNDAPVINVPVSIPSDGFSGTTNGISFSDDASENPAAVVSVNVTSVGASSIQFVDASGITGYTGPATSFVLTGTVAAFNQVFSRSIVFYCDGSASGSVTVSINDLGNNDATGTPTLYGVVSQTIIVDIPIEGSGLEAGFIGVAGVLSGAVFGAYKYMKKKKLIPEEADPWENDELFDMTLDNPLYSGTSPSSLEAVFDK